MADKYVLLIEDNRDDVDLTLHCFKKNNIANKVIVLRDGAEALEYLFGTEAIVHHQTTALILLDLKLPKIEGLEVLHRIRSDSRTKRFPVVILTSSKQDQDRANGYDKGANSYICKPVDLDQFNEAVRQLGFYWLLLNEAPPPPSAKGAS